MPAAELFVDQDLVDEYLERVERFHNNVISFEESLNKMLHDTSNEEIAPIHEAEPEMDVYHEADEPVYEEAPAVQPDTQDVVTAEDIDIEKLLADMNFDGGLTM